MAAPADALDLLWQRLDANHDDANQDGANHDDARFAKVGAEIKATWEADVSISMERDEREEIGRRAVLDIVCDVCERVPELESDWFAVSTLR